MILNGKLNSNMACLTFDDGPHPEHTVSVLSILERENIKATFFLVGENVKKYPHLVRKIMKNNHEIANHSMSHKEFSVLSMKEINDEVEGMNSHLKKHFLNGSKKIYFRPPKGTINYRVLLYGILKRIKIVLWSLDPKDYKATSKSEIDSYFKKNMIKSGDIVLLHDGAPYTPLALVNIIKQMKDNSIEAVTISEMLNVH